MNDRRVVLATPHRRYDGLENSLRERYGIEVLRIRAQTELTVERLVAYGPRYVIFPHWSWRIPAEIYQQFESVIFHMSDVPFGRGGSPLQNLVARGFTETKLTALRCGEELDAGPVYLKRPLTLLGTAEEILLRAADLMQEMIQILVTQTPTPQPQKGEPVIFRRRTPSEGDLGGASTLPAVYDLIRMLDAEGYPPAFLEIGPLRLEFTRASRSPDHVLADVRITIVAAGASK